MAGPPPSTTEDIRKMGFLIKIKTNKRKYFVLRDETKANLARLEYYDKDSKWRTGQPPKRSIILKNCFNINSKPDAKHKHAIALYTKDDCFSVACASEEEQQDWLSAMIELRSRNVDENTEARPLFEHIWPVTVKSKGLGGPERKVIPGQYRLCLTNKDLSLIRMNNDQSDIVLPLDCIRRCGHTHQFFFLELGRSAKTGSGNLWLQVEDNVIAQNIHEALLSSMKNNEVPAPGLFRIRSGSSATEKSRKRSSLVSTGGSSSLQPKRSHSIYTSNPSPKPPSHDGRTPSDIWSVSLSVSPEEGTASGGMSSLSDGTIEEEPAKLDEYMMITPSTVDHSLNPSNKFTSSRQSSSEGAESTRFTRSSAVGTEAIPGSTSKTLAVASSSSFPDWASVNSCDYVPMVTPPKDSYMEMSMQRTDDTRCTVSEEHGSNSSVSSVISSVGSMSVTESSERSFHSLSQLQEIPTADAGYIEMASPQNYSEQPGLSVVRPDIVPCYVRDESAEEFPKRAYSVGSKPVAVPNKPLNNSYIDMSGRSKAKKEAEKSSSAPHLNDDDEKKKELSDLFMELDFNRGKRDVSYKDQLSRGKEFRERASSGGSRELRMKAMSFSTKEAIHRLSLFGRNKAANVAAHADGRRARTSTICQESLRPRTSSFGPSDLRPRSSSGGNACFLDVKSKQMQIASNQSSQDSLRRHSKRSSQESVDSVKSDAYMDMNMSRRSSDRTSKTSESDAGYMDMKPGDDSSANYMRMTARVSSSTGTSASSGPGTSGSTGSSSTTSSEVTAPTRAGGGGIMMRQKLETVKAGTGDDYLEMVAEGSGRSSFSQTKSPNSVMPVQPRSRVTKSLIETGSNYLEMTPVSLSSEQTVSGKKETIAPSKYTPYMEMSVSTRASPSSAGTSVQSQQSRRLSGNLPSQVVQANHFTGSDKHEASVVPKVTSPKKDERKNSASQPPGTAVKDVAPAEFDIPPSPFELSVPLHSFLHYSDHVGDNTPTIPSNLTPTRTQHPVSGTTFDPLEAPKPAQISYATLDLGTSVDDVSSRRMPDGKVGGMLGRGRGFMPGSSQHVYAQIDFGRSDDHSK